jgi:hypothetical protein
LLRDASDFAPRDGGPRLRPPVEIISHRGYWLDAEEKNRPSAFHRSFDLGFGTETDVRDRLGIICISHDMPRGGEISLGEFLDLAAGRDLPLAINVKADGFARVLQEEFARRQIRRWFTFDMSVPEMVVQLRLGLPVYTRASEHERPPACFDRAIGVWLDAFDNEWYGARDIETFLRAEKRVCVVSSELHGRDPAPLWGMLKSSGLAGHPQLMLCSDRP